MSLLLVTFAGAVAGLGVVLFIRGLVGASTPLTAVVAELHRPRVAVVRARRWDTVARRLAGRPTTSLTVDLAACERDEARWVRDRLVWVGLGASPTLVVGTYAAAGNSRFASPLTAAVVLVGGATGGWLYARVDLASDAEKARQKFRHALAAYLELVTILMSGGAGVETSMFDAAAVGRGPAFRQLRAALTSAQARREPPWRALGQLGSRLGVNELEELEASMTLAGGGAQVRDSLTAKAASIRMKDLGRVESEAEARSETMVLPVMLMFAGFLVLIGYPALAALNTP